MTIEFITNRELENKAGKTTGKVKIMKVLEEADAVLVYTCPECGHSEQTNKAWEEPFLTGKGANKKINFACAKCGHNMSILKLRKEMAKDKKKGK